MIRKQSVAATLRCVDYVFLAADSMRARLVFNAVVHQYLIPGVQLGSKIRVDKCGHVIDVMSAIRPVRPGLGCLWCNHLVDPTMLAIEAKTDRTDRTGVRSSQPNPSVIALNAVSAAHAVNAFMLDYLGIREDDAALHFEHFHFVPRVGRTVCNHDETTSVPSVRRVVGDMRVEMRFRYRLLKAEAVCRGRWACDSTK